MPLAANQRLLTWASVRRAAVVLVLLAVFVVVCAFSVPAEESPPRPVAPGVTHSQMTLPGPLHVNILRVDLEEPLLRFAAVPGRDDLVHRERPSSIAQRLTRPGHTVVAAINADFGGDGNAPLGMMVRDGRLLVSPSARSSFALDRDRQPTIAAFRTTILLIPPGGGEPFPVELLNRADDFQSAGLFGSEWAESPRCAQLVQEVFLEVRGGAITPSSEHDALVRDIVRTRGGTPIPPGFYCLQLAEDSALFRIGQKWTLAVHTEPFIENLETVLTGAPRIVRDGKVDIPWREERVRESFVTDEHPRTGIGFTQDRQTMLLVVVDGRQPGHSVGASLDRLAEIMIGLGAHEALNLDGGGSSTMVVRGEVVNRPSDPEGERATTSSFVVISTAPQGPVATLELAPRHERLAARVPYTFAVRAYDRFWNPVEARQVEWRAGSDGVVVINNGDFIAMQSGTRGVLVAAMQGIEAAMPFEVAEAARWEITPQRLLLSVGEAQPLGLRAFDEAGGELPVPDDSIAWSTAPGNLVEILHGKARGLRAGAGTLTATVGDHEIALPFVVEEPQVVVIEDFEQEVTWALRTLAAEEPETNFARTTDIAKHGAASGRLAWAFRSGEMSAAYLDANLPLPEGTRRIALWVHGDGSNHLLRAQLADAQGQQFVLTLADDIAWTGEWRLVTAEMAAMVPHWNNPAAVATPPFTLGTIYVVEPRLRGGADVRRGVLGIDLIEAIVVPGEAAAASP